MREYVIMTDSCCDLTDHMAKELGLTVVPLTVHIDGHDYPNMLDGSAISFEDFYGKIRSGVLATTSAANVGQFQEAMRPILAEGKDIVSINFSSALSTTYQSACIAAQDMKEEFPDANIYVVDSLSASLGQGLLLYLAANLAYSLLGFKDIPIVDVTIVAQKPKLALFMLAMRENLIRALDCDQVNVKATTTERMGFEGEELGISAQAVALLVQA